MKIQFDMSEEELLKIMEWFFVPPRDVLDSYGKYIKEHPDHVKVDMDLLEQCKGE